MGGREGRWGCNDVLGLKMAACDFPHVDAAMLLYSAILDVAVLHGHVCSFNLLGLMLQLLMVLFAHACFCWSSESVTRPAMS